VLCYQLLLCAFPYKIPVYNSTKLISAKDIFCHASSFSWAEIFIGDQALYARYMFSFCLVSLGTLIFEAGWVVKYEVRDMVTFHFSFIMQGGTIMKLKWLLTLHILAKVG